MNELVKMLERDEGIRNALYDDATGKPIDWDAIRDAGLLIGHPTGGVGHNFETELTDCEIKALLDCDIKEAQEIVFRAVGDIFNHGLDRYRGLVCMAFQLGETRFRGFKRMISAIRRGDWERAANECLDSEAARKHAARYQRYANILKGE